MAINNDDVDGIIRALSSVALAITTNASPGTDETGGFVASLTEAVMGVSAGLIRISESIELLAHAVENANESDPPREKGV
jgi:hypothetical protein